MKTAFDCALNGLLLSDVHDRICVLDLREEVTLHPSFLSPCRGERLICSVRERLTVQVRFSILEEDPILRRQAAQALHAWAVTGGLLTTSDRPGQQISVLCTEFPAIASEDWTQEMILVFQSARVPYWESTETVSVSGTGILTLTAPGTAGFVPVDVTVINDTPQTIDHLTVRCADSEMIFNGIDFPAGGTFQLTQNNDLLAVNINGESILHCRTADSADLLLVPCACSCTVHAGDDIPLQACFTVRGRYA